MVKTAEKGCALHTEEFLNYGKSDLAYNGMFMGMKALLMTGIRLLMDENFLKEVCADFKEQTRGL